MTRTGNFEKLLDLAESLTLDEKETLLEVLHQRTLLQRRKKLAREVAQARAEHRLGRSKTTTPADLMREILE